MSRGCAGSTRRTIWWALVDLTGDTTLDVDQNAVTAGDVEARATPGSVRVVGGSVRVNIGELTDGPAAVLFPKR
jgi:hypothetical protein